MENHRPDLYWVHNGLVVIPKTIDQYGRQKPDSQTMVTKVTVPNNGVYRFNGTPFDSDSTFRTLYDGGYADGSGVEVDVSEICEIEELRTSATAMKKEIALLRTSATAMKKEIALLKNQIKSLKRAKIRDSRHTPLYEKSVRGSMVIRCEDDLL